MTEAVQASAEKSSVVVAKPSRTKAALAVEHQPEKTAEAADGSEWSVAKPEGRKRDRPKTAESEGKAEKMSPAATGKRQKSLFDF